MILAVAQRAGLERVVLSGGVFQNSYLVKKAISLLGKRGFSVYAHSDINTNDSGIPIGQIAIANARQKCA